MGDFLVFVCQPQPSDGGRLGLHIQIRRRHSIRDNQRAVAQAGLSFGPAQPQPAVCLPVGDTKGGHPLWWSFPHFCQQKGGPAGGVSGFGATPHRVKKITLAKIRAPPARAKRPLPPGQHSGTRRPCPQGITPPRRYPLLSGQSWVFRSMFCQKWQRLWAGTCRSAL